ncbi:flagellar biosynthesis/type III secretory pathway protein FliH [Herbaspirillum seropedicae]|uniref:FliH/SctL family protein n=1 Tax=Herbaspirillum seropedicae TaxID=964 RepID=UPI003395B09D
MAPATPPFLAAELCLPPSLRPRHGVVSSVDFRVTEDARLAAAQLVQQAQEQAAGIREQARADALAALQDEERRIAHEAGQLLARLREREASMLEGVAALAVDLALSIFERLLADTVPRERVLAACRRVREEAPPKLTEAVAWLHPDDAASLAQGDALPWELRTDARLAQGTCRLEAASGEWRADFSLAAEALRATLQQWNTPEGGAKEDASGVGQDDEVDDDPDQEEEGGEQS